MSIEDDNESRIKRNGPGEANDACSDFTTSDNEEEEEEGYGTMAEIPKSSTNIHMENTSEVQVGPRFLYNAPVTVNQHVHVGAPGSNGEVLQYALKAPLQDVDLSSNNIQGDYTLKTQTCKDEPPAQHIFPWKWTIIITIILVSLVISVTLIIVLKQSQDSEGKRKLFPDDASNENRTLPGDRRIFSKEVWFGQPAKYEHPLQHPTPFVVISHTMTPPCFTTVSCSLQVRMMQDDAMSGPNSDIDYNFIIGGEGNVYEGRGWDVANTYEMFVKNCNIGISVNGNFHHDYPSGFQITTLKALIELGIKLGKISSDYKLVPLSRINNSLELNPGENLYDIIENWSHFWIPSN